MLQDPLLVVDEAVKRFGTLRALDHVSFDVKRGTIVGLVGENGAGKSTLIHVLAGSLPLDGGRIFFHGQPVTFRHPSEARNAGIAIVHQEPQVVDALTVAQNVFLGQEPRTGGMIARLDHKAAVRQTQRLIDQFHMNELHAEARVGDLSLANRYVVAILRGLCVPADLLVLDEPTASSSPDEAQRLFSTLRGLRDKGKAIIFVSHRVQEVLAVADRSIVLRDGKVAGEVSASEATEERLISLMVGRAVDDRLHAPHELGRPLLSVRHLSAQPYLHDISFDVCAGEIVGLAGVAGSGRSRLLRCLFGVEAKTDGEIWLDPSVRDRAGAIALVPEDRKSLGLVPTASVFENLILPQLTGYRFGRPLRLGSLRADAQRQVDALRVRPRNLSSALSDLSGGNQQKVVLAKWLLMRPQVFLLDEPTRGVDVAARAEIHVIVRNLSSQGAAILVASSDLSELLYLSSRFVVLANGRVTAQFTREEATEETIMRAAVLTSAQHGAAGA